MRSSATLVPGTIAHAGAVGDDAPGHGDDDGFVRSGTLDREGDLAPVRSLQRLGEAVVANTKGRATVDVDDPIAGLEPGLVRRPAGIDGRHDWYLARLVELDPHADMRA